MKVRRLIGYLTIFVGVPTICDVFADNCKNFLLRTHLKKIGGACKKMQTLHFFGSFRRDL